KSILAKTLGASQLIYTASLMTVPDAVARAAKSLLFSFLWKKKKDKIKRNVVCQPLENGGLNSINFEIVVKSLRLAWIARLISATLTIIGRHTEFLFRQIWRPDLPS
ncbi:MAG: hypothetical protein MI923_00955, partial [Phycisphaerales bacterium]|nr:hypothetical protein [Phycisphaerales bacterium]